MENMIPCRRPPCLQIFKSFDSAERNPESILVKIASYVWWINLQCCETLVDLGAGKTVVLWPRSNAERRLNNKKRKKNPLSPVIRTLGFVLLSSIRKLSTTAHNNSLPFGQNQGNGRQKRHGVPGTTGPLRRISCVRRISQWVGSGVEDKLVLSVAQQLLKEINVICTTGVQFTSLRTQTLYQT